MAVAALVIVLWMEKRMRSAKCIVHVAVTVMFSPQASRAFQHVDQDPAKQREVGQKVNVLRVGRDGNFLAIGKTKSPAGNGGLLEHFQ